MKPFIPLLAISFFATGCATTLPDATGTTKQINSTAETKALLERNEIVLVGPRAHQESIQKIFMRDPIPFVTSEPNKEDVDRLGAALVPTTVIVTYGYRETEFRPTGAQVYHMSQLHKRGPSRIEFRGRTSNEIETPESLRIATERAESARRYYYGHGFTDVDMSINVRAAGDFVGDPRTESGRDASQRVEIKYFFEGGQS